MKQTKQIMFNRNSLLMAATLFLGSATALCAQESHPSHAADAATHAGHEHMAVSAMSKTATPNLPLKGASKLVYENYLIVQDALAADSMEKVATSAQAIAQAVSKDTDKTFPTDVATQAETLAKAKDLPAARKAFNQLSTSLIGYAKSGNFPAGILYEVYCPMAKASWLQADKTVRNPYYGKSMLECGQVKNVGGKKPAA